MSRSRGSEAHEWCAIAVYKLDTEVLRKGLIEGATIDLDAQHLLDQPQIGCWKCETPLSAKDTLDSPCRGEAPE